MCQTAYAFTVAPARHPAEAGFLLEIRHGDEADADQEGRQEGRPGLLSV